MSARSEFNRRLTAGPPLLVPLALDPLAARQCAAVGFDAVYLSGGALGYAYAVSEALLTLTEICDVAARITRRCDLPLIVDGGVGFGDAVHLTRAIWDVEATGAAAIEIEDQVAPKRVSHHRGI
ncbi:MAG: isocitrate lyase/phosphoenolpyruvate mutase family protein, partial [Actinomycetota bacterium]